MSQNEVGDIVGVDRNYVSTLERAEKLRTQ
ncbi:hypothetical protein PTE30175_03453 [Pandoraea terrae]|uniref:Uncharacterized protein n=1 Tax=Pandoraea terrae TaxID=1537710 RepID=A0A5E4WWX4_9BURK|nr:hypothetical protein PTE30175_03453 [Pandoraea terrae]